MTRILLIAACAGVAVASALAARQNDRPGPGRGGFVSPIVGALDTNRDRTISADEISAASASLRTLDRDSSGHLSADELRPFFGPNRGRNGSDGREGRGGRDGGAEGPGASADDLADTLMAFDRDRNGRLERAEVPQRFQGLFDRADANKDSVLTRDELKQSATASEATERGRGDVEGRGRGGRFAGGRGPASPLLSALDANGDRSVSAAEMAGAPASLKTLDQNGDGSLTPDEFAPAFGRRGGRGGDDAGARR